MKILNDLIPIDQIVTNNGSKKFLGFLITQGPGLNEVPFKIEQISTECLNTAWNTLSMDILNSFGDSGITDSNATISSLGNNFVLLKSDQLGQRNPPVRVCSQDLSGQTNNLFAIAAFKFEGQMDFTKLVEHTKDLKKITPILIRIDNFLLRQNDLHFLK